MKIKTIAWDSILYKKRSSIKDVLAKSVCRTPPPCPTSYVWNTPPLSVPERPDCVTRKRPKRQQICDADICGGGGWWVVSDTNYTGMLGNVSDTNTDSEMLFFLCLWTSGLWPTFPPSVVVHLCLLPPHFWPDVFDGWPKRTRFTRLNSFTVQDSSNQWNELFLARANSNLSHKGIFT